MNRGSRKVGRPEPDSAFSGKIDCLIWQQFYSKTETHRFEFVSSVLISKFAVSFSSHFYLLLLSQLSEVNKQVYSFTYVFRREGLLEERQTLHILVNLTDLLIPDFSHYKAHLKVFISYGQCRLAILLYSVTTASGPKWTIVVNDTYIYTHSLTAGVFGGHVEVNHVLSHNDVRNPVSIISNLTETHNITAQLSHYAHQKCILQKKKSS